MQAPSSISAPPAQTVQPSGWICLLQLIFLVPLLAAIMIFRGWQSLGIAIWARLYPPSEAE
ncbi:hypothetical protein C7271_04425 [filamentous cyanobacterium CCP5]|nr:hypothetical protein C7271_04425 [filamentous cyanobacterium CCP5]